LSANKDTQLACWNQGAPANYSVRTRCGRTVAPSRPQREAVFPLSYSECSHLSQRNDATPTILRGSCKSWKPQDSNGNITAGHVPCTVLSSAECETRLCNSPALLRLAPRSRARVEGRRAVAPRSTLIPPARVLPHSFRRRHSRGSAYTCLHREKARPTKATQDIRLVVGRQPPHSAASAAITSCCSPGSSSSWSR
jgi:hypothetical protein